MISNLGFPPPSGGRAGLIPKLRPLFCRVPKRGFSRTPWHNCAHPPVSVYGTDTERQNFQAFLGALVTLICSTLRLHIFLAERAYPKTREHSKNAHLEVTLSAVQEY